MKAVAAALIVAIAAFVAGAAFAVATAFGGASAAEPRGAQSDTAAMSSALRAMQADDMANPAMLSVADGEAAWGTPAGAAGLSCAGCHGDATRAMRGVAVRYPAFDSIADRPVDLGERISLCRTRHQNAPALPAESPERLALETFVGLQSRGMPIAPSFGGRMDAVRERGRALFAARTGQLNLSCAICHDANAGGSLAGTIIPQGHPVGYPIYRLEWQAVGSLQRRLRNCLSGVRAEPFRLDAPELVELEAFLMERAAGLAIETPAVRP